MTASASHPLEVQPRPVLKERHVGRAVDCAAAANPHVFEDHSRAPVDGDLLIAKKIGVRDGDDSRRGRRVGLNHLPDTQTPSGSTSAMQNRGLSRAARATAVQLQPYSARSVGESALVNGHSSSVVVFVAEPDVMQPAHER